MKYIVFFGKGGSNLINILNHNFNIVGLVTNVENSQAFKDKRVKEIETFIYKKNQTELINFLESTEHDLIVLLGFMRILPIEITSRFKIVNLHPSLLPKHKGMNAIENSFESKEGCGITLHKVNEELDGGEILFQSPINIHLIPNLEEYKEIIKGVEHRMIPVWLKELKLNKDIL